MTKRELFEVLADVADDANVYVAGQKIKVVVQDRETGAVILDETGQPFDGGFRVLFDPFGELPDPSSPEVDEDFDTYRCGNWRAEVSDDHGRLILSLAHGDELDASLLLERDKDSLQVAFCKEEEAETAVETVPAEGPLTLRQVHDRLVSSGRVAAREVIDNDHLQALLRRIHRDYVKNNKQPIFAAL
jgi:hypothetical protein